MSLLAEAELGSWQQALGRLTGLGGRVVRPVPRGSEAWSPHLPSLFAASSGHPSVSGRSPPAQVEAASRSPSPRAGLRQ